jgi:hypothetical protein
MKKARPRMNDKMKGAMNIAEPQPFAGTSVKARLKHPNEPMMRIDPIGSRASQENLDLDDLGSAAGSRNIATIACRLLSDLDSRRRTYGDSAGDGHHPEEPLPVDSTCNETV